MKKFLRSILLICFVCCFSFAQAQLLVQIDAGSRAPWGNIQSLTIDAKGQCVYYLVDVSGTLTDSSSFSISLKQLDDFLNKAEESGFFALDRQYHKGVDGAGIFISLKRAEKTHSVDMKNMDLPQINALVEALNEILKEHKIRIYYGQKNTQNK